MVKPKTVPKPLQACVTWMPFGAGIVSTAGFLLKQDTTQTAIAAFLLAVRCYGQNLAGPL
jgi:ABC-type uncharacterized transport system permease subunit